MKVTHQHIADRLGVSRALVTQALQRTHQFRIGEETRLEIERVAREMGYRPRNVTTHAIGLLMGPAQMKNGADMRGLIFLEEALSGRGYRLTLINPEPPAGVRLRDLVNRKTVDGVVLTSWGEGQYRNEIGSDVPMVVMSEEDGVPPTVDQIGIDIRSTLLNVFRYLIDKGHNRIGLLAGPTSDQFHKRVHDAARQAWEATGMPKLGLCLEAAHPSRSGEVALQMMQRAKPPSALVCADDYRMLPAHCALPAHGYRIPEDVSVIAMIDCFQYPTFEKAISATDVIGHELARLTAERLIARIESPRQQPVHQYVAGNIVQRASVGSRSAHIPE